MINMNAVGLSAENTTPENSRHRPRSVQNIRGCFHLNALDI